MRVLFVCSGNICRSPMAAGYLQHRLHNEGLVAFSVDSCGTLGIDDSPASPEAVRVMQEIGVDLTRHRSKGLSRAVLTAADVAIAMAARHRAEIERCLRPTDDVECWLLRAFEHGPEPRPDAPDLADPIGRPLAFYRRQVPNLVRCVDNLLEHLRSRRA